MYVKYYQYENSVTLSAQKLGLIAQPDKPLTDSEWGEIKERSIARDDFKNPCAICQDYFAKEDQVLLSCSHVFHRVRNITYTIALIPFTRFKTFSFIFHFIGLY